MNTRLNKYLSINGFCSRRQADELIAAGRVKINGQLAKVGQVVEPNDRVTVDNKAVQQSVGHTYLMVNKPIGVICTSDRRAKDNVLDLVGSNQRLFPVGRLDVESSGLLILTDDGELTNRLTHPRYGHEKEYLVRLAEDISDADLAVLATGIELDGTKTQPADIRRIDTNRLTITIREGRNRQIRRMCELVELKVTGLKRIRIGKVKLGNLPVGQWRYLGENEQF